jgi:nucleoid DNA-binding protein
MSLGKKDITKNISTKAHFSLKDSKKFLNSFLKLLKDNGRNNSIKISKFGTFEKKNNTSKNRKKP